MRRTALIEGAIVLLAGFISLAESLRIIHDLDPQTLSDVLGPGFYILIFSIILIVIGVFHILVTYKSKSTAGKTVIRKEMRRRMISVILTLVLYTFLISTVGYLVATLIFFFVEFRVLGVESWKRNAALTIALSGICYVVFVRYCNMIFPRGLLF